MCKNDTSTASACMGGMHHVISAASVSLNFRSRNKKSKKKDFYKRNLLNVGMAGWRHWLTKYTNKESSAHSTTLLHFTQPSLHK